MLQPIARILHSRWHLKRIQDVCLRSLQMAPQENSGCVSKKLTDIFNMGVGSCDVIVGGVSQTKALAGAAIGGEDILQNIMRGSIGEIDVFIVELMRYQNIEEEMVQL
ncbi:hypothetical protein SUGI_0865870 [Cryptomeria japonica]|nr:hypothetical protein SUGI_0865870 [Cryptomeria japonica]